MMKSNVNEMTAEAEETITMSRAELSALVAAEVAKATAPKRAPLRPLSSDPVIQRAIVGMIDAGHHASSVVAELRSRALRMRPSDLDPTRAARFALAASIIELSDHVPAEDWRELVDAERTKQLERDAEDRARDRAAAQAHAERAAARDVEERRRFEAANGFPSLRR